MNYTAGLANLRAACTVPEIKTIVTARAFVEQAKLGETLAGLIESGIAVRSLEDIATGIDGPAKLRALVLSRFAGRLHRRLDIVPDEPAVILFTSGSEGLPKGVVLTHRNLLANCQQLSARIDFNEADVVLNALPVFHGFGLTRGTLLPRDVRVVDALPVLGTWKIDYVTLGTMAATAVVAQEEVEDAWDQAWDIRRK